MNSSELDANAISKERIIWTHHGGDFHPRFNTDRTLRCFARHQRLFSVIDANKKTACCQGCFRCWLASPGQCVMKDDLQTVGAQIGSCEKVIIFSRCCCGGFSPGVKRVLDRAISLSLPFFTYRGGRVHHPLRYQNRPTLTVCFYGAVTDFERETAARLVEANRVNMGFSSAHVYFAEKLEFLTEVTKTDKCSDCECQSKIQGQRFCILFIPAAAVFDRVQGQDPSAPRGKRLRKGF